MDVLIWRLSLAGCTVNFLFLFYFLLPLHNFRPKGSYGFPSDWFQLAALGSRFQYEENNFISLETLDEYALDSAEAADKNTGE